MRFQSQQLPITETSLSCYFSNRLNRYARRFRPPPHEDTCWYLGSLLDRFGRSEQLFSFQDEHMTIRPQVLLEDRFLQERADEICLDRANPSRTTLQASPDTVYLTTADESGMMVSMIQSNYNGFGSGIVVPGTGISLQNRGAGFVLEEGHPNQVGGGKRPYHTIIPGFVMQDGKAKMSFGVMGAHMQAQGHIQMMLRVFVHGQNPQAASDAPRWYLQEDGKVALENGFDQDVVNTLIQRGHDIKLGEPEAIFGGAQLIYVLEDGYCGGSDHRKEGLVAGF